MSIQGRRRIAEGREAEIFEWDVDTVLKLYRPGIGHAAEEAALVAISAAGGPAPQVLGRVEVEDRPGLLIERVDGIDMLSLLERMPWRLATLAHGLAESHAALHLVAAPTELPDFKVLLEMRIQAAAMPDEIRSFALEHLGQLPGGDRLCHGDFHPANVMVTSDGISAIDWTGAARGDPMVDHARSALLLSAGDPPPGVSGFMRALVKVGRRLFSRVYERTYARMMPVDQEVMRHAEIVHVAARINEGIEVEIPMLMAFLTDAIRR